MRDLFLLMCFPFFVYYGLRVPVVALCLWFWTSIYPLQNWLWGIALSLRFNLIFALATIVGYFFMKNKPSFKLTGLMLLVIIFCLHSGLSVAVHGFHDRMWVYFENFAKGLVFFIFAILLIRKKRHFDVFLYFLAISICFYGVIEGLKVLSTGGGHQVRGIYGPLGDNNKVALGINMCIPLMLYLTSQATNKYLKLALLGTSFLCVMAVIGSASRGGFIGLIFIAAYYWWRNGKKISILFGFAFVYLIVTNLMPASWFDRMNTMKGSQTQESFNPMTSRITSWKINYLAALDNPFLGHGFDATATRVVWRDYVHRLDSLNWGVYTPVPNKGYVAHSIYFEVLGNQGFLGLIIYLSIIIAALLKVNSISKKYYSKGSWERGLLSAIAVSIVGYCISGAALSAAYFELFYALIALVICMELRMMDSKQHSNIAT